MTLIPVSVEGPSAACDPRIIAESLGAVVSWRPERGWPCAVHLAQPCPHTVDLQSAPPKEAP